MATDWLMLQSEYLHTPVSLRLLAEKHGIGHAAIFKRAAREGWATRKKAAKTKANEPETPCETVSGVAPASIAPNADSAPPPREAGALRDIAAPYEISPSCDANPTCAAEYETQPLCEAPPSCDTNPVYTAEHETHSLYEAPPSCDADRLAQLQAIGDQLTAQLARAATDLDKQVVQHKRRTKETTYGDLESNGKPVEETIEERIEVEVVHVPVNSAGLHRLSTALKILREVTLADSGDGQSLKLVTELMKKFDTEAGKEAQAGASDE